MNRQPIASPEQYQRALLRLRDEKLQALDIPIFKAFADARANTLTATQLAETCRLGAWSEANLRFGLLGQRMAKALGYTPTTRRDGSTRWYEAIATGATIEDNDGANYAWTLRPELIQCLKKMKWI